MSYTAPPMRYDHELLIGDTYQPASVTLLDATEAAYDLTGVTGECVLTEEPGGVALLTPVVTVTDAAGGTFTWASEPTDTSVLVPGKARYAVRLTWVSGVVRTVLEGVVTIRRTVLS